MRQNISKTENDDLRDVLQRRGLSDARGGHISAYRAIAAYMHMDCSLLEDKSATESVLQETYGILDTPVTLSTGWSKNGVLPMLIRRKDGAAVAVLPCRRGRYRYYNDETTRYEIITPVTEREFAPQATCFYLPFPKSGHRKHPLRSFLFEAIGVMDFVLLVFFSLLRFGTNALLPFTTRYIFGHVIQSENLTMLLSVGIFIVSINLATSIFMFVNKTVIERINRKLEIHSQAAAIERILNTPVRESRRFTTGELVEHVNGIINMYDIGNAIFVTLLYFALGAITGLAALVMIAPQLLLPSLAILALTAAVTGIAIHLNRRIEEEKLTLNSRLSDFTLDMMRGISKLKISGASQRAFNRWMNLYGEELDTEVSPPLLVKCLPMLVHSIGLLGALVLYAIAARTRMSAADFTAFQVAFAAVMAEILPLTAMAMKISMLKPLVGYAQDFLKLPRESDEQGRQDLKPELPTIECRHLDFDYPAQSNRLFEDFSLTIRPGEYLAIVGPSGSGKSTLVHLLIGFEQPKRGGVYYGEDSLNNIKRASLLQNLGILLQSSQILTGTVMDNLRMAAPKATEQEAIDALHAVGLDAWLANLPEGLSTVIGEGAVNLSGGQQQQLLLAGALLKHPRVFLMDEATSALDNITQSKITTLLDSMDCTRIVVAHRLSTIKKCRRILLLDEGKIAGDGSYDELLRNNPLFREMVASQLLDPPEPLGGVE